MATKRKLTDNAGNQFFPITHTQAVLDSYGNTVEQILDEQTELINQKQMAVGAVPSDLTPTEGSTHWVTSGGVYNAMDNKADKEGYYPSLGVGQSDDLKDTGGDVIKLMEKEMDVDGNVTIGSIRGNLVKWNQFGMVRDFSFTATNNTVDAQYKSTKQAFLRNTGTNLTSGHKYYLCFDYTINQGNVSGSSYLYIYHMASATSSANQVLKSTELVKAAGTYRKEYILPVSIASSASLSENLMFYVNLKPGATVDFSLANFMAIDLTLIFGSGNEPNSASAFKNWLKENIGGESWYAQNLGSMIPVTMTAVKSTGGSGASAFQQTVYMEVTEITGKLGGEGESFAMFANGMCRIGEVYDEISGSIAYKRIGSRAYEEGDVDGDGMVTNGTTTYYVLATEEFYTLDHFELPKNIRVANGGTLSLLPENGTTPTTSSCFLFIQKPLNAVGIIKDIPLTYVSVKAMQEFSEDEKSMGRENIGAVSVDDFESLENDTEDVSAKAYSKVLYTLMEPGNITMNSRGWTYTDSTVRIRTKEGVTIRMEEGDKISLTKNINGNTFYVGIRSLQTGKYTTSGGWVNSWTATEDCEVTLCVQNASNPVEYWTDRVVITRADGQTVIDTEQQNSHSGRGNLRYYGQKVDLGLLRRNNCVRNNFVEMYYMNDGQPSDGYYTRLNQSMAISNRRIFLFNDTTGRGASYGSADVVVLDYDSREVIYRGITGSWQASHHNNAQFFPSRYKFDPSDKYPLLLLSRGNNDSTGVIAFVVRVQETENNGVYSFTFTIVKTINVDLTTIPSARYNGSMCVDGINNKLYLYYTKVHFTTTSNNWLIIDSFDLDCLWMDSLSGSVTLSAAHRTAHKDLNYYILQGACCYGGKIFMPLQSASTVNSGFTPIYDNHFVAMIDPSTGTIESMIPSSGMENEGIAWYLGKMYVSIKNGSATSETTTPMFRIYEYVF